MRLEKTHCVVPAAFDADFCQRIIDMGEDLKTMDAAVAHDPTNKVRQSTVSWIGDKPEHKWLFDAVMKLVEQANAEYWRWDVRMAESMQYTRYGSGQYYTWHADQRKKPYDEKSRWPGMLRKISMTVNLAHSDDYEGGDFMIEEVQTTPERLEDRLKTLTEARGMGNAIIFPSHLYHQVTEVTGGQRRSLVAWFLGPPFV